MSASLAAACPARPALATTPEDRAARILSELDASGPFIISTEGEQLNISIWWTGTAFIVTNQGSLVSDALTQIGAERRLSFRGAFDADGAPSVQGTIDYPDDSPWLVFDVQAGSQASVHVSPDLLIGRCSMKACRCDGLGGTVPKECTPKMCDANDDCRKSGESWINQCAWHYNDTPCIVGPQTPIPVDEMFEH